jgi:hypothetical protein
MHRMETYYEFNFKITCNNKSKYVTVKGTSKYASTYIAGYIQRMNDDGFEGVEVDKISANTLSTTIKP